MVQEYSIIQECKTKGFTVTRDNCSVVFDSFGNVAQFGSIGLGEFEGDPDIAGRGVVIAFLFPSVLVPLLGLILAGSKLCSLCTTRYRRNASGGVFYQVNRAQMFLGRLHTYVDDIMLATADAQLLLVLAFGISYYSTSQCEISLYHYLIATHMILIGLATSALAYSIVRKFYTSPLTVLIRGIVFFTGAIGLFLTKGSNRVVNNDIFLHKLPGMDKRDSVIILPAYCLLEEDLNPLYSLSTTQQDHLIPDSLTHDTRAQIEWILTIATAVFGCTFLFYLYLGCSKRCARREQQIARFKETAESRWASVLKLIIRASFLLVLTTFVIWNFISIVLLRHWINGSQWLKREDGSNPEYHVRGIGQITPLVALGTIVFAISNSFSEARWGHLFQCQQSDDRSEWPTNGPYTKV